MVSERAGLRMALASLTEHANGELKVLVWLQVFFITGGTIRTRYCLNAATATAFVGCWRLAMVAGTFNHNAEAVNHHRQWSSCEERYLYRTTYRLTLSTKLDVLLTSMTISRTSFSSISSD